MTPSSFFNLITNRLLLLTLKTLTRLPLNVLRLFAKEAALCIHKLSHKSRQTITDNLTQAQLSLPTSTVHQAIACGAIDMLWVWFHPTQTVANKITVLSEYEAIVHEALNGNQATILLTPHLGCFEALAKWIAHQTPLTAMYRRPTKEWVAQIIETARTIPNLTMARANTSGVRTALKTLKSGGLLGILPDQVPKHGEGLWLSWFGRDAYTINLPAKLHLATQARMYIIYAIPTTHGWQIECEKINTLDCPKEAEALSRHLNTLLENTVKRHPLYYAWSYKRYKPVQPTVTPT
jgi:Kdo2-lipid IVA lauroyltransferase/acyltransferase